MISKPPRPEANGSTELKLKRKRKKQTAKKYERKKKCQARNFILKIQI